MDGKMILVVLLIVVVLYAACRSGDEGFYASSAYDCSRRCGTGNCSYDYSTGECAPYIGTDWRTYDLPSTWSYSYPSNWGRHYYNGGYRYGRWGTGGRWHGRRR